MKFEKEYNCETKIDENGEKIHVFKWKYKGLNSLWTAKKNSGVLRFKKKSK